VKLLNDAAAAIKNKEREATSYYFYRPENDSEDKAIYGFEMYENLLPPSFSIFSLFLKQPSYFLTFSFGLIIFLDMGANKTWARRT
jgi:hypothetical protein